MLDDANCFGGTCWIMQTARGEHARGARAITVTILAIAALGHYHNLAGLGLAATEFERLCTRKLIKKRLAELGSFIHVY
jgi:hypothetical protein